MTKVFNSLVEYFDRFTDNASMALWFSGGEDSRLTLEAMIAAKRSFSVLRFDDGWNREQKAQVNAVIARHNIQAYSYPALRHSMVRKDDGELALVSEYPVSGGVTVPIIRDLADEPTRCAFEIPLEYSKTAFAPATWRHNITGLRRDDRHWVFNRPLAPLPEWATGESMFWAPLFDWTKDEVKAALTELGIDLSGETDTGDVLCCTGCLKGGEIACPKADVPKQWSPEANLEQIRLRYGGINGFTKR